MPQGPDEEARTAAGDDGAARPPEPLPDDVARKALRGDPEAEAVVEEKWEEAKSMEGEAPTG
jgi:hypothetical protein